MTKACVCAFSRAVLITKYIVPRDVLYETNTSYYATSLLYHNSAQLSSVSCVAKSMSSSACSDAALRSTRSICIGYLPFVSTNPRKVNQSYVKRSYSYKLLILCAPYFNLLYFLDPIKRKLYLLLAMFAKVYILYPLVDIRIILYSHFCWFEFGIFYEIFTRF